MSEISLKRRDGSTIATGSDLIALVAEHKFDLQRANLQGVNLQSTDLCGTNLQGANLQGANLRGADLRGTDLQGANLHRAVLRGANLHCAVLRGANMCGAYLEGAHLYGANLHGANLRGAYLEGAQYITSFGPVGDSRRINYAVLHQDCVMVQLGCFGGSSDSAIAAVRKRYGDAPSGKAYVLAIEAAVAALEAQRGQCGEGNG